jgi:hypothetical protein
VFGAYSDDPHLIELDSTLKELPTQLYSTLIHEVLEAIIWIYGIKITHANVEQLSTALCQVFSDNKQLGTC